MIVNKPIQNQCPFPLPLQRRGLLRPSRDFESLPTPAQLQQLVSRCKTRKFASYVMQLTQPMSCTNLFPDTEVFARSPILEGRVDFLCCRPPKRHALVRELLAPTEFFWSCRLLGRRGCSSRLGMINRWWTTSDRDTTSKHKA